MSLLMLRSCAADSLGAPPAGGAVRPGARLLSRTAGLVARLFCAVRGIFLFRPSGVFALPGFAVFNCQSGLQAGATFGRHFHG